MTYPYYIVPAVEKYRLLPPDSEEAKELSRFIAANIGDYPSLRLVLGIDPPEFARFYPDMETATPSTLSTIDSFLDKYGGNISAAGYEIEDQQPPIPEEESPANSIRDLLKRHKYDEAIMLIEQQNLNNTQKSIYFAHQMRFIKKLMALEKFKNKSK